MAYLKWLTFASFANSNQLCSDYKKNNLMRMSRPKKSAANLSNAFYDIFITYGKESICYGR